MDTSKPFIGYKSAGRRPERNNDREGAKGAPLAAIRGWIAGTAGLPGDIEGLVRMLPGIERKEPVLPTSDFYKEWLPLRGESPVERAFTEAGSLTGGAGVGSAARALKTGATVGSRGALSALNAAARNAAVPRTLSPQAGVIKMKGGNWLDGSVEDALKRLKSHRVLPEGLERYDADRWVNPYDGEVFTNAQVIANNASGDVRLNNWIDKKLVRYIKKEMATPEDPVRALAERGVLHVNPAQVGINRYKAAAYRNRIGTPALGESEAAKAWEDSSDMSTLTHPASQWLKGLSEDEIAQNPWLKKVPPETDVNRVNGNIEGLGFNHLIDELRNATNPESGLPRELLLKYDALDKVTVPQAVERVSKINEWRAAQKAEANAALANNAATVLHKEYPEGYRWVELKAPPLTVDTLPNGFEFRTMRNNQGGEYFSLRDLEDGGREVSAGLTPEAALKSAGARVNTQSYLEDALKYEGDTMGHCVGGYCDDVASGKSRIYSLRDKKGQPHTTIEVGTPRNELAGVIDDDAAEGDQIYRNLQQLLEDRGIDDAASIVETEAMGGRHPAHINELVTELYPQAEAMLPKYKSTELPSIIQIKGKGNKAPNPKYLPYVQDFVRSGKWSDVGDLQNTGLKARSAIFDKSALEKPEISSLPEYFTQDELEAAQKAYAAKLRGEPGFADGGAVNVHDYDPNRVDALVQALEAGFGQ